MSGRLTGRQRMGNRLIRNIRINQRVQAAFEHKGQKQQSSDSRFSDYRTGLEFCAIASSHHKDLETAHLELAGRPDVPRLVPPPTATRLYLHVSGHISCTTCTMPIRNRTLALACFGSSELFTAIWWQISSGRATNQSDSGELILQRMYDQAQQCLYAREIRRVLFASFRTRRYDPK